MDNLLIIKPLLEEYKKRFFCIDHLDLVKNLIDNYKNTYLFINSLDDRRRHLYLVKDLIEDFKFTNIFKQSKKYDIFKSLNLNLNENELTKITADVLDPKKIPFGKEVLQEILQSTECYHICSLLKTTNEKNVKVIREYKGEESRIDIRIFTINVTNENVVIDFEFKLKDGSETIDATSKKYQTDREWNDLLEFVKNNEKMNIKYDNIVAYFVTPDGEKSKNDNFVPISRYTINEIILKVLSRYTDDMEEIDVDGVYSLKHFFKSKWIF